MKVNKDYYDILGVSPRDSQERIKQVFRKKAQLYHPDQNPNDKFAEEMFKGINEAYSVLGDKVKREAYDRERRLNQQASSATGPSAGTTNKQPKAQSNYQPKSSGSSSAGSTPKYKPRAPKSQAQSQASGQSSQTSGQTKQTSTQPKPNTTTSGNSSDKVNFVVRIVRYGGCVSIVVAIGLLMSGITGLFVAADTSYSSSKNATDFILAIGCLAIASWIIWIVARDR